MAIPDFQDCMLPVLQLLADGAERRVRDLVDPVADQFQLTQTERTAVLPSGERRVIHNRVGWAKTYLVRAELLISRRRGHVQITDKGRALLESPPARLDVSYLKVHFPSVLTLTGGNEPPGPGPQPDPVRTPEEALEEAYQQLRTELAREILSQVKELSPAQFERLVVELLVKMGYGGTLKDAGRAVGKSGDGGIDGIIKEDRLGLDVIYIQAKRYADHPVSRPDIQAFVGALQGVRARKGVFITTSRFAQPAREYGAQIDTKVVLIDGEQLAEYMIDFDLGVTKVNTFEVKRLDSDYFEEG